MDDQLIDSISFSGKGLLDIVEAVLEKKAVFRFQAKGHSMSPWIKNGDIVSLAPFGEKAPDIGDVVAFKGGALPRLVVHRIVAKGRENTFMIKGDNMDDPDGFFKADALLARVVRVERAGKSVYFGGRTIGMLSRWRIPGLILPLLRRMKGYFSG